MSDAHDQDYWRTWYPGSPQRPPVLLTPVTDSVLEVAWLDVPMAVPRALAGPVENAIHLTRRANWLHPTDLLCAGQGRHQDYTRRLRALALRVAPLAIPALPGETDLEVCWDCLAELVYEQPVLALTRFRPYRIVPPHGPPVILLRGFDVRGLAT